ncbi:MAG: 2-C-methyl-D-erythritol 4-phosphate cytidylyltransferase [Lachnospiraceae bacterium]|nr:2-C-methyl-D-erythritol 4-phosphate cytidylyltransferase [Lachnospiraceae bacterium]
MNYAIILAGGKGARFQGDVPKQFVEMTGYPMLVYSLRTAQENKNVDVICVSAPVKYHGKIKEWAKTYRITKLTILAEAGKERYESVYNGIMALPAKARDTVIIMTAVCPFVSQKTMDKLYEQIELYDASITVIKATDAITFSNNGKMVNRTLQKKKLFVQQGPQIYRYGILKQAHQSYRQEEQRMEVNEDSELVLNLGVECSMVMGDRFCIKVTYPEDLAIAEALHPLFDRQEMLYGGTK